MALANAAGSVAETKPDWKCPALPNRSSAFGLDDLSGV